MKDRVGRKKARLNPVYGLFVLGFLSGVLIPNLMWREIYVQGSLVSVYFLECLSDIEEKTSVLLQEVMRKRMGCGVLLMLCGISIFGVPVSFLMIGALGFELGSVLTCSILQFGVQGGVFGIALLFPHSLFYIPAMFGLCTMVYKKSLETWNNLNIFNRQFYKYIGKAFVFLLVIQAGIMFEVYCCPQIIKIIIKTLKIFS